MKLVLSALARGIATTFGPAAMAQGETGDVPKAQPYTKRTPEQKAAGKAQRRTEGRAGARDEVGGEVGPVAKPGARAQTTKEERKQARATRRQAAAKANKAGEIPAMGEVGPKP